MSYSPILGDDTVYCLIAGSMPAFKKFLTKNNVKFNCCADGNNDTTICVTYDQIKYVFRNSYRRACARPNCIILTSSLSGNFPLGYTLNMYDLELDLHYVDGKFINVPTIDYFFERVYDVACRNDK